MTGSESRFVNGPFAGLKLGEAWPKMPPEWLALGFPAILIFPAREILFTEEKLSVQVHPPDYFAAQVRGNPAAGSKTEMWYVVQARPGAEVMAGLKPGVTRGKTFRAAIADGTAEDCLQHIGLVAGDVIFVPAGTAHTMGPGLVICESGQHSDHHLPRLRLQSARCQWQCSRIACREGSRSDQVRHSSRRKGRASAQGSCRARRNALCGLPILCHRAMGIHRANRFRNLAGALRFADISRRKWKYPLEQ